MYPQEFFSISPRKGETGRAFALMPFAPTFASVYETIKAAFADAPSKLDCFRADELFGGGHIIRDILEQIDKAEVVIADVTGRNPNVFYELGIAHTVKAIESVWIITQAIDDVPFDLRHLRCLPYEPSTDGLRRLHNDLLQAARNVLDPSFSFSIRPKEEYTFPDQFLGPDRCFYSFTISDLWGVQRAAKFRFREHKSVLLTPPETIYDEKVGLACGEATVLTVRPWLLKLKEVVNEKAYFRVYQDVHEYDSVFKRLGHQP